MFIPNFILITLFRRSRGRETRNEKLNKLFKENVKNFSSKTIKKTVPATKFITDLTVPSMTDMFNEPSAYFDRLKVFEPEIESSPASKKPPEKVKSFREKVMRLVVFPWWMKIVAYILSGLVVGVSIAFIIFKGITFGDEAAGRWLTSFLISILTSIFITQPIQVIL